MQLRRLLRSTDWPLRRKVALLLFVALTLPLGIEIVSSTHQAETRLIATTVSLLAARADQLASNLDTFNRAYDRSADHVAHLPDVVEFCQANGGDRERLKSVVRTYLQVWPASDPTVRGIAILDLSGNVKVATEDRLVGMNLSYHRYIREALRGVSVISDVYIAEREVDFAPTIAFVEPVFGPGRRLVGISAMWVRATGLWSVAKASNELAGAGSYAILLNHQGIRIAHTFRQGYVFHPAGRLSSATVDKLVAEDSFGKGTRQLLEDVRPYPEVFDRARAESIDRDVFRSFSVANQSWNYAVARRFETVPWTAFYMIPERSLDAQITQTTRKAIAFAGLIILLPLFAWFSFAAQILKRIVGLSKACEMVAGGDLSVRIPGGHADELGKLGANFNSMAEHLVTAREAALAASRAKSEFLASMSHEIRTPMNAILGMAELLADSPLRPEQKKYLEIMTHNGAALLDLINGILDLARIESGQLLLEQAGFDLESVVDRVVETLAIRAEQKQLEMLDHMMPDVPTRLIGDPLRLRQVLLNLIGNAVKFTEKGQVLLTVAIEHESAGSVDLHFSVADSGIGIPKDKLESVFASFTQVDSSTTRKYGGTGLGLTIVRQLVSLMGGRVWVESELGRGATFQFTARFGLQTGAPVAPQANLATTIRGVRVLVVDDNHTNRLILREMLSRLGAEVDEAADGATALNQLEQARAGGVPYRLMLLDCRMPEMDGFQVAERAKANGQQGLACPDAVVRRPQDPAYARA
jgi:signal transduction histidine kinase/CheY-like chemotaxis protein